MALEIAEEVEGHQEFNALLRRVRDFAQVKGDGNINKQITQYSLTH